MTKNKDFIKVRVSKLDYFKLYSRWNNEIKKKWLLKLFLLVKFLAI